MGFFFFLVAGMFSGLGMVFDGNVKSLDSHEWWAMIRYSIEGLVLAIVSVRAYAFETASKVALVQYLNIIFSYLIDFLFLGVQIGANQILGILMIMGCFCINAYTGLKPQRTASVVFKSSLYHSEKLKRPESMVVGSPTMHLRIKRMYGKFESLKDVDTHGKSELFSPANNTSIVERSP